MNPRRLIAAALLTAVPVSARTWRVGGPAADFPLITPAVAAASAGDTVVVARGTYREDLVLDKTIEIRGDGWPILMGTGQGTIIEISANHCGITGLAIEESGMGLAGRMDAGIRLTSGGNRIRRNRLRRVYFGIIAEGGTGNLVADNVIEGFGGEAYGRRGDGVYLYRETGDTIERNEIRGMRDAIYLQYAPGTVVAGNTISESRYGLHDMFTDGARFVANTFTGCAVGANVMNCRKVEIRDNEFVRNRGVASAGLSLKECDNSAIEGNTFRDESRALQVEGSSQNRFSGNRFLLNDTAVALFASAEENLFTGNVFDGNLTPVILSGGSSSTRWSVNGRGNFWSGYRGFDFEGRGIGREPQPVVSPFARIEGNNSAARLFFGSPAAAALDFAASSLILESDGALDRAPLARRPREGRAPRRPEAAAGFGAAAVTGILVAGRKRR